MLTREQFLGSFERRYIHVETSLGKLRIQNLNEDETADFQAGQTTADGKINEVYQKRRRRKLVAACLVDEQGNKLLQPGDLNRMGSGVDGGVITAVFLGALKHCGFLDEEETVKLEKNSDEAPADASPTA